MEKLDNLLELKRESERLVLTRFTTFEDMKRKIAKKFKGFDLSFRNYDFKSDYDNDFEDYSVIIEVYDNANQELLFDLQLYYAITRIGERIIVEVNFERF